MLPIRGDLEDLFNHVSLIYTHCIQPYNTITVTPLLLSSPLCYARGIHSFNLDQRLFVDRTRWCHQSSVTASVLARTDLAHVFSLAFCLFSSHSTVFPVLPTSLLPIHLHSSCDRTCVDQPNERMDDF